MFKRGGIAPFATPARIVTAKDVQAVCRVLPGCHMANGNAQLADSETDAWLRGGPHRPGCKCSIPLFV